MKRLSVNITPPERFFRVGIGFEAAGTGILLLAAAPGVLAVVLLALLVVAGVDSLVTGALGHSPLYARLHHSPQGSAR